MKPRRRSSRYLTDRAFAESLQRIRLEAIARGEAEPICPREQYFLWTLKSQGQADPADYIVPWPLLVAEGELIRMEREADRGGPNPPRTMTLEPSVRSRV